MQNHKKMPFMDTDLDLIGGGNTKNQAILATIAAALSFINMN